MVNQHRLAATA